VKYKVGDKILVAKNNAYSEKAKKALLKLDYIVTIKKVAMSNPGFIVEEFDLFVPIQTVVGIYENPVENRFELLDIRSN